jgi:anaerobic magnesium-protoporphyrin IX monomethyl ester cyclase
MKIFFIYPNSGSQVGFNYGVAHLASVLKAAGHQVRFWQLCEDLEPLPDKHEFIARIQNEAPDLLAFSVVTNQWPYTMQLARWGREELAMPQVCGGIHALLNTEEILRNGLFDYVFRGECEEAFAEFVETLSQNKPVETLANLACVRDGQVIVNPVRPLPILETLPRKDYEMMDFQKLIDAKNGWVGMISSRGCPFSCTYCFNHRMVAAYRHDLQCSFAELNYIRHFRVDQIIHEMKYLLNNYRRIKMFILDDDLFTFDPQYVKQFCREYKKLSDIPFVVNAHVNFFNDDIARDLAEANCRIVKFGVESGSPRIRDQILNRHMSNDSIIRAIQTVHRYGMHSSVFLIIGFPHETREDLYQTIRLMATARPGRFRWTFFYPFPGTKAWQISRDAGYINEEKWKTLKNFTDGSCLDFGPEQNLILKKIGRIMPWFVNAESDGPVADFYRRNVEQILALNDEEWKIRSPGLLEEDTEISRQLATQGLSHYAVKYNSFTGVISDYFLNENNP